ncbi:MAG: class I SAM-dependent methyltransferase [Bacteroidia bacterium]
MFDRERPSFEDSNNVTVKRCFFAYEYASEYVKNKITADIGCADGYGTQFLADYSNKTTGVDYSAETVKIANEKHKNKTNLNFISSSVPPLPFEDNSLEVITAFQFIEHIEDRLGFIKEVKRVLKPGGTFLCSTPNIKMSIARNPFHVHEYTFDEMKKEAGSVFDKIELYGVQGNDKVNKYYEDNAKWAKKILKLDPLGIHKILPASWLVIPYNWLTSLMRKNLKETNSTTLEIKTSDFFLTQNDLDQTWDIFLKASK